MWKGWRMGHRPACVDCVLLLLLWQLLLFLLLRERVELLRLDRREELQGGNGRRGVRS